MNSQSPREAAFARILWLLPRWPLPAQDGARVANINLLKGLTGLGARVDVMAIAGGDERCEVEELRRECGISECAIIRRARNGGRFGVLGALRVLAALLSRPWLPVTLLPYAKSGVVRGVRATLLDGRWDLIVYDGLHSAAHSQTLGVYQRALPGTKTVYRAHNVETEIWDRKRRLTRFFPLRLFLAFQTFLMRRFEESVLKNTDAVMTVSEVDLAAFQAWLPGLKGTAIPIAYDFGSPPQPPDDSLQLLFLGKMDWPPNSDGLRWFLEKVWPDASRRRPALKLWIAGSGDSKWLRERSLPPKVQFLGRVADLDGLYRASLVSIVPIFYGSGTRVKAIEASRYGRACLGTALGVDGLGMVPGETYLRAETAEEWIEALVDLRAEEAAAMGRRAHEALKKSYHLPAAAEKFIATFHSL